jgi:hypothetical protein
MIVFRGSAGARYGPPAPLKPFRQSLKTRSWERAEQIKRTIEEGKKPEAKALTFKQTSEAFMADLRAQNRVPDTIRKYALYFGNSRPSGRISPISGSTFFSNSAPPGKKKGLRHRIRSSTD